MIQPAEEKAILDRAYVPEHIVRLMTLISGGEPFLIGEHLCLAKDDWAILVGYALDGNFTGQALEKAVESVLTRFRPRHLWFIAPEVPPSLARTCRERESDRYYKLDLQGFEVKEKLRRILQRASRDLAVEKGREILKLHQELIAEFLEREKPNLRVKRLFLSMAEYVTRSETAVVLTARDKDRNVSAFYVVELAAKDFGTYLVGCHSKTHYVLGASDLLFLEMVNLARERGKTYLHLGLGVNEGIRRFKEKWGGVPYLTYEFCERSGERRQPPLPPELGLWR